MSLSLKIFLIFYCFVSASSAEEIDVVRFGSRAIKVVVQDNDQSVKNSQLWNTIGGIVRADLDFSGYFNSKFDRKFVTISQNGSEVPNLDKYHYEGLHYIIDGLVIDEKSPSSYKVTFDLYDTKFGYKLATKSYIFNESNIRTIGHIIADVIMEAIVGKKGYFRSKIIFLSEPKRPAKDATKDVFIVDQDGYNLKKLTHGGKLIMYPSFFQRQNLLLYTDITGGEPKMMTINSSSGEIKNADIAMPFFSQVDFDSRSFTPISCNKKNCMAFSVLSEDGSYINYVDLDSGKMTKITSNSNINTYPSFSPSDDNIVYESNKSGRRCLYVYNIFTGFDRKLPCGNGSPQIYAQPSWSPDGKSIAFLKQMNGLFHIGLMDANGDNERIIYSDYYLAQPLWLPNGDGIMFTGKGNYLNKMSIKMINLEGIEVRKVMIPQGAVEARWIKVE